MTEPGADASFEIAQPVSLPRARHIAKPGAELQSVDDSRSDRIRWSLESFEVSCRSQSQHTPALRATITPQPYPAGTTVKQRFNKTVSPEAIAPAPGAALRLRPRKIPPSLHYLLERNADEQYHWITLLRASRPVHYSGGSSDKPPPDTTRPFIPTIPPLRSTYCEKISPFKSVQFGTLQ